VPVEVGGALSADEFAVEVDGHLEPRVRGDDLHSGCTADRVADDPDVFEVEAAGQRRAWVELRQSLELVEHEAGVCGADVDQPLDRGVRRGPHHAGVDGLPDDVTSREH
jgi:hypothetical protein